MKPDDCRLLFRTTALQAVCTPDCEQAQFYATHHLTEIAAAEWEAAGLTPQRPEDVLALLKPLALWGDPEDQVMLDLGISLDLTQYVLTVRFDTAGSVEDVVMMS